MEKKSRLTEKAQLEGDCRTESTFPTPIPNSAKRRHMVETQFHTYYTSLTTNEAEIIFFFSDAENYYLETKKKAKRT